MKGRYYLENSEGIQNIICPCCRSNRGNFYLKNSEGIQNIICPCCRSNRGQTIVEYIIILGIVIIALYAMGPYMKRGVQSVVKATADQLAVQNSAEQDFSPKGSHLDRSDTLARVDNRRHVQQAAGWTNTTYDLEQTDTLTNTMTNLGFSP